ncbi:hypothetical protein UlMin_010229 [Ulmus minor]
MLRSKSESPISPFHLFFIFSLFVVSSFPTARSEYDSSALRLPSDRNTDLCGVSLERPNSCPCGCADVRCAGVKVAKLRFCEVGNGGSAPLSAQALLLVHMVWLIILGFSVLFDFF